MPKKGTLQRCPWCGEDPDYVQYHDQEWGLPLRDSRALFALLILEGAQAGLSWITILRRRRGYYEVLDDLDPERLARWGEADIERALQDARIIRNRRKVLSAVTNAKAFLALEAEGSFAEWAWSFVDGKPLVNHWASMSEVPALTPLAEKLSKELKARGFSFVGPTIVYSWMQSAGMVNDHLVGCFRHPDREAD